MSLERHVDIPIARDQITIMVVGDVRLYREGIAASIALHHEFRMTYAATGCADAVAQLSEDAPDIIVLDMSSRHSLEFVRNVTASSASIRVIAFAVEETERDILRCAEAGAAGYVPSNGTLEQLIDTIRSVSRGELLCSPSIAASLFKALRVKRSEPETDHPAVMLTARERQVVPLLDRGLSNKEIAATLHIEVATVKNHVHNLLEKLHVASRGEAAARLRAATGQKMGRRRSDAPPSS